MREEIKKLGKKIIKKKGKKYEIKSNNVILAVDADIAPIKSTYVKKLRCLYKKTRYIVGQKIRKYKKI